MCLEVAQKNIPHKLRWDFLVGGNYIMNSERWIYYNEKEPLDIIESHKKHIKEKGLSKLKKTYYKKIK
jgi:hypothetical protein